MKNTKKMKNTEKRDIIKMIVKKKNKNSIIINNLQIILMKINKIMII